MSRQFGRFLPSCDMRDCRAWTPARPRPSASVSRTSRAAIFALALMPWFLLRIVPSGHCVDRNGQCHVDSRRLVVSTSYLNTIRFINPNSPHMDIAMANGGDAGESDVSWHLSERHKYVRDRRRHRSGGRGFDSRAGYPRRERLSAARELADERAARAVAARELEAARSKPSRRRHQASSRPSATGARRRRANFRKMWHARYRGT